MAAAKAKIFDTLSSSKKLQAGGFQKEQAEALTETMAELISSELVTKADLTELRKEIVELKNDIIKWIVGISFGQIALILSILKLIH